MSIDKAMILDYVDDFYYIIVDVNNEIVDSNDVSFLKIYKSLLVNSIVVQSNDSLKTLEYYSKDFNKWYEYSEKKIEGNHTLKMFKDITKYKTLERSLQIDFTTELPNKRLTDNLVNNCIAESKERNEEFAVIFGDIDFFKSVNDTYGHECGDAVLGYVGEILKKNTRQKSNHDYPERPLDITGRLGGEEFLIVLRNISAENAIAKAEKLRKLIEAHRTDFNGTKVGITISLGVYHVSLEELHNIKDIDKARSEIMHNADNAMYASKKSGRNRVILYEKFPNSLNIESNIKVKNI